MVANAVDLDDRFQFSSIFPIENPNPIPFSPCMQVYLEKNIKRVRKRIEEIERKEGRKEP